ncbi:MAG: dTDP-glucose 4,6-dehydratase [Actinomycetota bacterium]|nr:dTDP-glucose 4,6-dehydratase [Actinomycetota bacterium]
MRVLVTGGAGFIGSHYVRSLLSGAYPGAGGVTGVTVYDKLTYAGNLANLAPVRDDPRLRIVQEDIIDSRRLDEELPGHDAVINFAAETHVDRSISGGADFVVTNVLGAQTLFDACLRAGVPRVVHISTDEVYGSVPTGSSRESDRLDPNSPYSAAKAGGDLLARAYSVTHGLNVSVTRCSNNYGPYQFPEKVLPLFVTNLLDGQPVPLYGDGLNVRDWLHVDDHCRGVQVVLEHGRAGEFYNIGGGTELTNRDLTDRLLAACGADESMVTYVEDRKGHDRRYSVDWSAIGELGYRPQVDFDEGLAATVDWYRQRRDWWEPLKRKAGIGT